MIRIYFKDKEGRRPADLLDLISNNYLREEVRNVLREPACHAEFLMTRTPLKKLKKSYKGVATYFSLFWVTFLLNSLLAGHSDYFWFFTSVSLFFLDQIIAMFCICMDPGFIEKDNSLEFTELLKKCDASSLCPFCEVIRGARSRHCNFCNRCVDRFDHHCPWINNCVGRRNHIVFLLHLICVQLYCISVLIGIFIRKSF